MAVETVWEGFWYVSRHCDVCDGDYKDVTYKKLAGDWVGVCWQCRQVHTDGELEFEYVRDKEA